MPLDQLDPLTRLRVTVWYRRQLFKDWRRKQWARLNLPDYRDYYSKGLGCFRFPARKFNTARDVKFSIRASWISDWKLWQFSVTVGPFLFRFMSRPERGHVVLAKDWKFVWEANVPKPKVLFFREWPTEEGPKHRPHLGWPSFLYPRT